MAGVFKTHDVGKDRKIFVRDKDTSSKTTEFLIRFSDNRDDTKQEFRSMTIEALLIVEKVKCSSHIICALNAQPDDDTFKSKMHCLIRNCLEDIAKMTRKNPTSVVIMMENLDVIPDVILEIILHALWNYMTKSKVIRFADICVDNYKQDTINEAINRIRKRKSKKGDYDRTSCVFPSFLKKGNTNKTKDADIGITHKDDKTKDADIGIRHEDDKTKDADIGITHEDDSFMLTPNENTFVVELYHDGSQRRWNQDNEAKVKLDCLLTCSRINEDKSQKIMVYDMDCCNRYTKQNEHFVHIQCMYEVNMTDCGKHAYNLCLTEGVRRCLEQAKQNKCTNIAISTIATGTTISLVYIQPMLEAVWEFLGTYRWVRKVYCIFKDQSMMLSVLEKLEDETKTKSRDNPVRTTNSGTHNRPMSSSSVSYSNERMLGQRNQALRHIHITNDKHIFVQENNLDDDVTGLITITPTQVLALDKFVDVILKKVKNADDKKNSSISIQAISECFSTAEFNTILEDFSEAICTFMEKSKHVKYLHICDNNLDIRNGVLASLRQKNVQKIEDDASATVPSGSKPFPMGGKGVVGLYIGDVYCGTAWFNSGNSLNPIAHDWHKTDYGILSSTTLNVRVTDRRDQQNIRSTFGYESWITYKTASNPKNLSLMSYTKCRKKSSFVEFVLDQLTKNVKDQIQHSDKSHDQIKWIVAHSYKADDEEIKVLMEMAKKVTESTDIEVVREDKVALLWCQHYGLEKFLSDKTAFSVLDVESQFFSTRKNGEVETLDITSNVVSAFEALMCEIFDESRIEDYKQHYQRDWLGMVEIVMTVTHGVYMVKRADLRPNVHVSLAPSFAKYFQNQIEIWITKYNETCSQTNVQGYVMYIDEQLEILPSFFDPHIDRLASTIVNEIDRETQENIHYLFLIGRSAFLEGSIEKFVKTGEYKYAIRKIKVPRDAKACALKGSVLYGLRNR